MRIAKVVGNMTSVIKDEGHYGYKFLILDFLGSDFKLSGEREIGMDAVGAGIGDTVLTCKEGGCAKILLEDEEVIANLVVCGIVDHYTVGSARTDCV